MFLLVLHVQEMYSHGANKKNHVHVYIEANNGPVHVQRLDS